MFKSTDKFLVLGRSGCGKSYLTRGISSAYPRKVIFDTLAEYTDSDGVVTHDFDDFCKKIVETENDSQFTLIYQFDVEQAEYSTEFNEALRVLWYRGNVFICVEEIQNFATPHSMPMWLKNCLLTGRHRNVGLIFTTQRPGECNKTIISQASHIFCGSIHERNDIEYTRSVLNDKCYELIDLPEREFIYFQPGKEVKIINNNFKELNKKKEPAQSKPVPHHVKRKTRLLIQDNSSPSIDKANNLVENEV